MNRRNFLKSGLAAAAVAPVLRAASIAPTAGNFGSPPPREYYELRAYRLKAGISPEPLHGFLEHTFVPALIDRGLSRVGVFTEMEPTPENSVWMVIAHPTLESAIALTANLYADPAIRQSAGEYWQKPTADHPAFDRIDTWLSVAFASHPQIEIPSASKSKEARIFELRTYQSFSEERALKKIEMFNAGEIPIMHDVGLGPVFFGQTLIGRDLPQLTYMLCGRDRASHAESWKGFQADPRWLKLKNDPIYANTVSKVISRFLVPTPYSPI